MSACPECGALDGHREVVVESRQKGKACATCTGTGWRSDSGKVCWACAGTGQQMHHTAALRACSLGLPSVSKSELEAMRTERDVYLDTLLTAEARCADLRAERDACRKEVEEWKDLLADTLAKSLVIYRRLREYAAVWKTFAKTVRQASRKENRVLRAEVRDAYDDGFRDGASSELP